MSIFSALSLFLLSCESESSESEEFKPFNNAGTNNILPRTLYR